MVRHLLGEIPLASITQVNRDARGTERVIADLRCDPGFDGAPPDHPVCVGLAHRPKGQIARATHGSREEKVFGVVADPGALNVGV